MGFPEWVWAREVVAVRWSGRRGWLHGLKVLVVIVCRSVLEEIGLWFSGSTLCSDGFLGSYGGLLSGLPFLPWSSMRKGSRLKVMMSSWVIPLSEHPCYFPCNSCNIEVMDSHGLIVLVWAHDEHATYSIADALSSADFLGSFPPYSFGQPLESISQAQLHLEVKVVLSKDWASLKGVCALSFSDTEVHTFGGA
ncbi:hypothetical protein Dimus_034022 [Dionaea muscipula]